MSFVGQTPVQVLQVQRHRLSSHGELDLSGPLQFDRRDLLAPVGSQKKLTKLYLRDSPLTSLQTLPPQPSLKTLIADNSRIENLAGFNTHSRLSSVSLVGTPISETENFRLSVLLCVGPRLSVINGSPVTENERKLAQSYPPIARHLVARGWIVQYPPPSKLDFKYLARQFKISVKAEDLVAVLPAPDAQAPEEPPTNDSATLADKISDILRPMGFVVRIGQEHNNDILNAVAQMCKIAARIEAAANPDALEIAQTRSVGA
jgi:Leucine-rich repeat (LRR) protein